MGKTTELQSKRPRRGWGRAAPLLVGLSVLALSAGVAPQAAQATSDGSVRGVVVDVHGAFLAGVCLTATQTTTGSSFTTAPSDLSGVITQANVHPGSYRGYYWDCGGAGAGGVTTKFGVTSNTQTNLGQQQVPPDGAAFGQLLDARTGQGAPSTSVTAFRTDKHKQVAPPACTDSSGGYTLGSLPTTGVKLEFANGGCANDSAYVSQWYGGTSFATATIVPIASGCCGTSVNTVTLANSAAGKAKITSVTMTGVSTLGSPSNPTVTVKGSGFGSSPPTSTPVPSCPGDPATGLGVNYLNGKLYINDNSSQNWQAGFAPGDCIGLVVSSYSPTKIVFSFGSWYQAPGGGGVGPSGDALAIGDPYTMTVKGTRFTGIVQ
jgi:hypothetical protein